MNEISRLCNFETNDKRDVLEIIAIRVGDLMISGIDLPVVYVEKNESEIRGR